MSRVSTARQASLNPSEQAGLHRCRQPPFAVQQSFQGVPCSHCTDACVQGGIIEIVVHKQWQDYEKKFGWDKWIESAKRSDKKLKEAGINVRVFDGVLGMQGVLDGKVIDI